MTQLSEGRARRSSRVLVSLPLAVSGQKHDGSHVSGAAETILVNRHGARIRCSVPLEPHMQVRLALLAPYKWRVGEVVWADTQEKEYGIELGRPENFWGIYFPPEDWELGVPGVSMLNQDEISGAIQSRQRKKDDPDLHIHALQLPEGGTIAILRGIAANGLPFQERDLILPVGENHASMMVGPLVNLGTPVQVIFAKNQVEQAMVSAVAHSREYDRWRLWMQFTPQASTTVH